jgi:hypothetical protein
VESGGPANRIHQIVIQSLLFQEGDLLFEIHQTHLGATFFEKVTPQNNGSIIY